MNDEDYLDTNHPFGVINCPECLDIVDQEELDMFGGLCEECSGAFND